MEINTPIRRFLIDESLSSSEPLKPDTNITIPRNTPKNVPMSPMFVGNDNFDIAWS